MILSLSTSSPALSRKSFSQNFRIYNYCQIKTSYVLVDDISANAFLTVVIHFKFQKNLVNLFQDFHVRINKLEFGVF